MTYTHPAGFPLSTSCVALPGVYDPSMVDGTIDDLDGVVNNEIVLGSGAVNDTLIDFSCAANPYFVTVDIQPSDPPIINNNNIPVQCGTIASVVCEDINLNGLSDPSDPGFDGITVQLFSCSDLNTPLATQVTSNGGQYSFGGLVPGCYRLFFDNPAGYGVIGSTVVGADGWSTDININFGDCNNTASFCLTQASAGIGNLVWHDLDGDGIQDSGEPGIPGVRVELFNDNGFLVDFTFTDGSGFYLFDGLAPGHYYVGFEDPDGYSLTGSNRGNNDNSDSDVDGSNGPGTTASTWLDPAELDLSWDAGYYKCIPLGDYVWYDSNNNNRQDPSENGINGVRVNLYRVINGITVLYDFTYTGHRPGTASDDGYYIFCAPPGDYYVEFEVGSNLSSVSPNSGGSELDSDVTNSNGQNTTGTFTLLSCDERFDIDGGYRIINSISSGFVELPSAPASGFSHAELAGFSGNHQTSHNLLTWRVENDAVIEYYEVSRLNSENVFTSIGKLISSGEGELEVYELEDYDFKLGLNQYKLVAYDKEGQLSFERLLDIQATKTIESEIKLYPNITTEFTNLEISVSEVSKLKVSLLGMNGAVISTDLIDTELKAGMNQFRINTDVLNPGIYFMQILIDNNLSTKKLIVIE